MDSSLKPKEYDILVIGAGAGTKLVTPPSLLGKRVAVFEKETPGGTCLNRGCIPSKMLIYPTEILFHSQNSSRFPIHFTQRPQIDFASIVQRVSRTVDADANSIPIAYDKNPNITLIKGKANFVNNSTVQCNGELFTAPLVFISVGSRPYIPAVPGLQDSPFWTSREALRNEVLPKSLIVVGGGYIGLELGCAYAGYGTKVSCFTRSEILRGCDGEVKEEFRKHAPFAIQEHSTLENVEFRENIFRCTFSDPNGKKTQLESERLLIATGITPNTEDLGCETTDVTLDSQGFVEVDNFLKTKAPGVYAFGDCIGNYFFRHSANFEGEYLFRTLFDPKDKEEKPIVYPPMPSAVFSYPQIASVGETEEQLVARNKPYWKGTNPYSSSAMGMARMSDHGFVKLLFDPETETLLGAHIIGEEASNLIQMFVLGMTMNLTLEQYLSMIFIHPALPEISRNALRKIKEVKGKYPKGMMPDAAK